MGVCTANDIHSYVEGSKKLDNLNTLGNKRAGLKAKPYLAYLVGF